MENNIFIWGGVFPYGKKCYPHFIAKLIAGTEYVCERRRSG